MVLNLIWVGFFLVAIATAIVRLLQGDAAVFPALMGAMFDAARTGFEISLGLVGIMALWLGIMRVGERAGVIDAFARLVSPLFALLFPSVPRGHAAQGAVMMNVSANLLGLDNAATPLGLKAMRELQTLNPAPERASDAQTRPGSR
jgi:spore maturation protein SpmA